MFRYILEMLPESNSLKKITSVPLKRDDLNISY